MKKNVLSFAKILALSALLVASGFFTAVPQAFATAPTPAITLGASIGKTGDVVSINGTNYHNNDTITVTITGHTNNITTSAITVSSGSFSGSITIPSDATEGSDTVTASDTHSNSATKSFTFDKTAPNGSIAINSGAIYTTSRNVNLNFSSVSSDVTQMELRNGTVGSFQTAITYENPHAYTLPNNGDGTYTVSVRFTDSAGNKSTGAINNSIILDTTAPVIAAHADVTAGATSSAGAVVTYTSPTTSDNIDAPDTATCSPLSGTIFAIGTTTVTCNAADTAGNVATPTTFTVTIAKITPTLSVTNSPVTYNGSAQSATVSGSIAGVASNILTGGFATKTNVGTYAVTANFTPTDSTNYNSLSGASAGNFVINQTSSTTTV